jgi:hypothetical protein
VYVALIGDVGGHRELLVHVLEQLGVDVGVPTIPTDLTIVQVGDLVDRGPDSAGCVELVNSLMGAAPGQWIQLLGNHEGNRLGGPAFWDEGLEREAEATLLDWWEKRRAALAVALRTTEFGDLLVSHGGLTATLWHVLGKPPLADVAATLNSWVGDRPDLAFAPGALLGARGAFVGPTWADALTELYPSWERAPAVPFGQVHGHSSICTWPSGRLRSQASAATRAAAQIDVVERRTRVDIDDRPFVGIDPTLGTEAVDATLSALVVEGEILAR